MTKKQGHMKVLISNAIEIKVPNFVSVALKQNKLRTFPCLKSA